jgi:ABC-type transport system substrate-binding protein
MFSHIPVGVLDPFKEQFFDEYLQREYLLSRWTGVFFQLDRPVTKNPFFREALWLGVPKERILNKEKGWSRIDSVFFFEGVEDWQETNFPEARKLLRDHGFPYNKKLEMRTMGADGEPVKIKMITTLLPPVYSRFAQNIARIWKEELDIEVAVEVLDTGDFQKALKSRDYDLVLFGQDFSQNPDAFSMWHSFESGALNLSNLTSEPIDLLIEEIRFSGARSDVFSLGDQLRDIIPVMALATPQYNILVSQKLKGFSETFGKLRAHHDRLVGMSDWYFFEERDWDWPAEKSKLWGFVKWIFTD